MSSTEMKSYLSLIPISAKVRRRQNRMTILCIVLAVFLVTAVFSMADMAIRMETSNQLNKNGNWHIMVKNISPETAAKLAAQEDVAAFRHIATSTLPLRKTTLPEINVPHW